MLPQRFQTARLVPRLIAPEDGGAIFDAYAQDAAVVRFLTWRQSSPPMVAWLGGLAAATVGTLRLRGLIFL